MDSERLTVAFGDPETARARRLFGALLVAAGIGLAFVEYKARGSWPVRRVEVPLRDLLGVELVPVPGTSRRGLEPDYDLYLVLRGEARVQLLRAFTKSELEADRAAIFDFFRAQKLFGGGGDPSKTSAPASTGRAP